MHTEIYRGVKIVTFQDDDGWGFTIEDPSKLIHTGDFGRYPTCSKARLEARRELLHHWTTGLVLDVVDDLEEQGKISTVDRVALENSIMDSYKFLHS